MTNQLYYAPARNYDGKALCKVTGLTTDTRGQMMIAVEAVHGAPWNNAGMWGYSETAHAKFYPEHINLANENATTGIVTLSQFDTENLLTAILADIRSAK